MGGDPCTIERPAVADLWTRERVLDLAPDAASAKAAHGQAKPAKWDGLGRTEAALWGEIKGSGKKPYQTRVDLTEPAFKCSCPSRKFPCKHALGILLVLAEVPDRFVDGDPPDWVADWLAARAQRAVRAAEKRDKPVDKAAQAKRAANREAKVEGGIAELRLFLEDLVRHGLAAAQGRGDDHWRHMAARLVDAQAPGLARLVRALGDAAATGDGWQDRFLAVVGRLYLATRAYDRLKDLPADVQADLRAVIGWTQSTDEVLSGPAVRGRWMVAGRRVEDDGALTVQRTWLFRTDDLQPALILDFAAGNQPLDVSLTVGSEIDAEIAYYPSAAPLRALVKQRFGTPERFTDLAGKDIGSALEGHARALAANPWLERWPVVLVDLLPISESTAKGRGWFLTDRDGRRLPTASAFGAPWSLVAVSGGHPVTVIGEWDGEYLLPLGIVAAGRLYAAGRQSQGRALAQVA